jgi:stress response protein SCP2
MYKGDIQQGDAMPTLSDEELAPVGVPLLPDGQELDVSDVITIGAAWDASSRGKAKWLGRASRKMGADLDAVAVLFQDQIPVTLVAGWEPHTNPLHGLPGDGSITHTGDNTTGDGEGDDEAIRLVLNKIPGEYHRIVVQVAAFKSKNRADKGFQGASNVLFKVYDGEGGANVDPAFCIRPSLIGTENCVIVAVLDRVMTADGRPTVRWKLRKSGARVKVRHGDQNELIMAAANAR